MQVIQSDMSPPKILTNPPIETAINIRKLSSTELLLHTKRLALDERRIGIEVLHHLREIERRRIYADIGYASLFDYVVKELEFTESSAYHRISAMRAMRDLPELEEALQTGKLSVSTVSQVQSFLRAEAVHKKKTFSKEDKASLFRSMEGKSTREVQKELVDRSPVSALPKQREKQMTEEWTELRVCLKQETLQKLKRLQDLVGRRFKEPSSYAELIDLLAELGLKKFDPLMKMAPEKKEPQSKSNVRGELESPEEGREMDAAVKDRSNAGEDMRSSEASHARYRSRTDCTTRVLSTPRVLSTSKVNSRYISSSARAQVWKEARGRCTYRNPKTGIRCGTTRWLEIEHLTPHALGGTNSPDNLTLLCKAHNWVRAKQAFGRGKIEKYERANKKP